jgi:PAS domain S-box-containing protein
MQAQSTLAMTIIDFVMLGLAAMMLRFVTVNGFFGRQPHGRILILLGVLILAAFYVGDLTLMHLPPLGDAETLELTQRLHEQAPWLITSASMSLLAGGFLLTAKSLARDQRRVSLMTDALPLAVAYVDREERYQFVNARYLQLHNRPRDVMLGAKAADVLRPDLYQRFKPYYSRALRGETQIIDNRIELESDRQMHDMHVELIPDEVEGGKVAGFFILVQDVTARLQLEREVVRAAEAERLSVARDLHDGLGQALTGISLGLGALARKLHLQKSPEVHTVENLSAAAQKAIGQTRQFTHLLAPTMQGGLFAALRSLAAEVSTLYDVECFTRCPPQELEIGPAPAMHLYRIAQESVNNAARHGRAATIVIDCHIENESLVLAIIDDGLGMPHSRERRDGFGIKSMYYRSRMLGGQLRLGPLPDGGTEVSCTVPLESLLADPPPAQEPAPTAGRIER